MQDDDEIPSLPANGWAPRKYQMPVWNALRNTKYTVYAIAAHRRWGKDELMLHHAAAEAMQRVGNYWHMLPKQVQAYYSIWEGINPKTGQRRWQDAFPEGIIQHVDNKYMKITFTNGSTWQLIGSDNYQSVVGSSPVGVVFSESALSDPNAYGYIRPILLENNGWSVHISTVRGRNYFYDLFNTVDKIDEGFAFKQSVLDTKILTPEQLEHEKETYIGMYGRAYGLALFNQEWMCDWDAAIIGSVFGDEIRQLKEEGRAAPYSYNRNYPVYTSWDLGIADPTVILFWQIIGNNHYLIDWYSDNSVSFDTYAALLASKPYFYAKHLAPHDMNQRELMSGLSRLNTARNMGIKFEVIPRMPLQTSISTLSNLFPRIHINIDNTLEEKGLNDCSRPLSAFEQYSYKFNAETKVMSKTPNHDWTSHYTSAAMTYALYQGMKNMKSGERFEVQGSENTGRSYTRRSLQSIISPKKRASLW